MATDHSTAGPRTFFARKDLPPPRPRLAANVVCMYHEDRPPVQQSGRRGRYPRNVFNLARWMEERHIFRRGEPVLLNDGRRARFIEVMTEPPGYEGIQRVELLDEPSRLSDGSVHWQIGIIPGGLRKIPESKNH